MTAVLVIGSAVGVTIGLYALLVRWSARSVRAEAEMREDMRRAEPPVLGGAPRHLRPAGRRR